MKRIRTLIADDEPLALERIRTALAAEPAFDLVAVCTDGDDALDSIRQHRPDVAFLDIDMPGKNGFEVVKGLEPDETPHVVFVTAFNDYAVKAFDVHAIDYLLKPLDQDRFNLTVKRLKQLMESADADDYSDRLTEVVRTVEAQRPLADRIMVKTDGKLLFLKTDEIDWIDAAGNYVQLHTADKTYLSRDTMNNMESKLDPNRFLRIHRSTIVNLDRIKEMQPWFHGEYQVRLTNGTKLYMSRSYRQKIDVLMKTPG